MKHSAKHRSGSGAFGGMLPLFAVTIFVFVAISALVIKVAWLQTEALMINKIAGLAAVAAMEAYARESDASQKAVKAGEAAQSIVDTNFTGLPVHRFSSAGGSAPAVSLTLGNWNFAAAPACTTPCFATGGAINAVKVQFSSTISSESILGSVLPDFSRTFDAEACAAQLPSGPVGLVEQ